MLKHYDLSKLTLEDFGYLLSIHPLEVWCAGELTKNPNISWNDLMQQSAEARKDSSQWLFKTKNRRAQDVRLRTKIEEEAFARMLPYWQHVGFPFDHLVPSLATAIGSSADRPIALAELIGIISNDGVRMPMLRVQKLHFADQTPYETEFEADAPASERVMNPLVAKALKGVLVSVVDAGTAVRVKGAFKGADGKVIPVGGKTGSGDNRFKTFARGGGLKSARATSRTGTFVFFIGDRYFGVLTAYVAGDKAEQYVFTSALPVAVLKLLAPAILSKMESQPPAITPKVAEVQQQPAVPVKQPVNRKATN
jgi:membrane peptidoglycan carboxypeptidase